MRSLSAVRHSFSYSLGPLTRLHKSRLAHTIPDVIRRIALVSVALLGLAPLGPHPLRAQVPYNPTVEEAPESLMDLEIGDAEVDLFAVGNWITGIGGALGFAAYRGADGSRELEFPHDFPGLDSVPFYNMVDLTISLWLLQQYFFETTVSDDLEESTLLFGYAGLPGAFVQSVLIGTTGIDMGQYPYLGFGDETGSLGQDEIGRAHV